MRHKYEPLPLAVYETLKYQWRAKLVNYLFHGLRRAQHPVKSLSLTPPQSPQKAVALPAVLTSHPLHFHSDNPSEPSSFYHLEIVWDSCPTLAAVLSLNALLRKLR